MTDDAAPIDDAAAVATAETTTSETTTSEFPAGEVPAASPISLTAEHSWEAAAPILYPVLRPAGSRGLHLSTLDTPSSAAGNVDPLLDDGPADLLVGYALAAGGFDILANGDHLAAWGVSPATLRDAAFRNLEAWSTVAPWSVEAADHRHVISSDTGDGWDASRILLPDAIAYLEKELGGPGDRVLVGLPARHLLVAGCLHAEDQEFAPLFADFVLEYAGDSDEEIDRRLFELRDGRLTPFDPATPA
jgi:uncharacterized protein YtpQ (UPF0354 family)